MKLSEIKKQLKALQTEISNNKELKGIGSDILHTSTNLRIKEAIDCINYSIKLSKKFK